MFTILGKICDKLGISFSYNRSNSPSNKAVLKASPVGTFQQAGGDINNNTTIISHAPQNQARPKLDVVELGGTGGADGTFISFKVQNDGDEVARDVRVEFVADDFNGGQKFDIANLPPNKQSSISYRYDGTDLFKRQLKNPRIVLMYNSGDGRSFESGRTIVQEARADGRWNIHTKQGTHFESVLDKGLEIEIERTGFNKIVTTPEGLAESFTLTVPLLIKNPSDVKMRVRNLRPMLELPDGYQQHVYYENLNAPEGRDIAPKDFLSCTFGIAVNTRGREKGVNDENPEYVENKNKILAQIQAARIGFSLRFETVSLKGVKADEVRFDLTDELLPQLKIDR